MMKIAVSCTRAAATQNFGRQVFQTSARLASGKASPVVRHISSKGHVGAIWEVADVVDVPLQRRRQRRTWGVRIGLDHLRVIVLVARLVQWSALRKVADIVDES